MKHCIEKILGACALVVLGSAWCLGQTGQLDWRPFKSEAGGFSVELPGEPQIIQTPFEKGPIKSTRYTHVVLVSDDVSLTVEYFDMPPGPQAAELMREGGMSSFTRPLIAAGATLVSRGTIVRETCEGLEAVLSTRSSVAGKNGLTQARIFSSGLRFYVLVLISEVEDTPAIRAIARKFFESFSVTGGCNTLVPPVEAPSTPPKVENVPGEPDKTTNWRRINRRELGFSVLMPGSVRYQSQQAQLKPVPLMHHEFGYERDDDIMSVEVIGDYPPKFYDSPSSLQNLLDITIYSLKKNFESAGVTLAPARELSVAGFPGREFSINSEKKVLGRVQVYGTPLRAYVFVCLSPDTNVLNRFFGSIMISQK